MQQAAPENIIELPKETDPLIYELEQPFKVDDREITQLSLDFSKIKSKQFREVASLARRKIDPDMAIEFTGVPQLFLEFKLVLLGRVNGIIFEDLDNNLCLADLDNLSGRIASFLRSSRQTKA